MFNFRTSNLLEFISINPQIVYTWPYILFGIIGIFPLVRNIFSKLDESNHLILNLLYDLTILLILGLIILFLLSSSYNQFIYFRF